MKRSNLITFVVIVIVILATMFAVASPALAENTSCDVECMIAERVPNALATLKAQALLEMTETALPSETPTETATETPVVTETPSPTETELPGPTFTVDLWPTEFPGFDPNPDSTPSPADPSPVVSSGRTCYKAWMQIVSVRNQDVGYRYFDNPNHAWCKVWLMREYGIDYDTYKALNG